MRRIPKSALYAANDNLYTHTAEYTVTAYDESGTGRIIASGICRQQKNSSSFIQRIAESETPQLWIIRWREKGVPCTNHVFTQKASYEVMRSWIKIIGEQCGFVDDILELS